MSAVRNGLKPMGPRDPLEAHRAATPLELLFDLVTVISVAAAAGVLHHAVAEGHAALGLLRYFLAFFVIWWAWMNFTWFASAYDNDDAIHRLLTMVIMAGSLMLAAGLEQFVDHFDIGVVVAGYVVMRLAMCLLWLRAAAHDQARRRTNIRYAAGIAIIQCYWTAIAVTGLAHESYFLALVLGGFVLELAIPAYAERAAPTPWHRHHIIERYGLLIIIVLGETLLSSMLALQAAWSGHFDPRLVHIALSALIITFGMWWIYFAREEHLSSTELRHALLWGYGHFFIFAAGAAVGAGFAVLTETVEGAAHISMRSAHFAITVPLSIYLAGLWVVRDRLVLSGPARTVLPASALILAIMPFALPSLEASAVILIAAIWIRAKLI